MYYSVTIDWWIDHILSWSLLSSEPSVICPIGFCGTQPLSTNQMWSMSPAEPQLLFLACSRPHQWQITVSTTWHWWPEWGTMQSTCQQRWLQIAHSHNGILLNFLSSFAPAQGKDLCHRSHAWKMLLWSSSSAGPAFFPTTALKISVIISVVNYTICQTHSQNYKRKMSYY